MCPKSKPTTQTFTPAASPAAPLPVAEEPTIGDTRRQENLKNFGKDTPTYRAREDGSSKIKMA